METVNPVYVEFGTPNPRHKRPARRIGQTITLEKNTTPKRTYAENLEIMRRPPSDEQALKDLFSLQTANQWMTRERTEPPKMLFDRFWLQGELCFLFADTNMGKSLLAVQIAESIARGQRIRRLLHNAEPCPVLYVDFELDAQQFELRYSTKKGKYEFSENFHRAEFNQLNKLHDTYNDYNQHVMAAFAGAVKRTEAKVLIIDNLTAIHKGGDSTAGAIQLMKMLKQFKQRHNLSILVLAHTPKRDPSKPLSRNDLQGSKMLINFCDSAFAIGESYRVPGNRYLKQIKARSTMLVYGTNSVVMCFIRRYKNFLEFKYVEQWNELDHVYNLAKMQRDYLCKQVGTLYANNHTQRMIASELRISLGQVNKIVSWIVGGKDYYLPY